MESDPMEFCGSQQIKCRMTTKTENHQNPLTITALPLDVLSQLFTYVTSTREFFWCVAALVLTNKTFKKALHHRLIWRTVDSSKLDSTSVMRLLKSEFFPLVENLTITGDSLSWMLSKQLFPVTNNIKFLQVRSSDLLNVFPIPRHSLLPLNKVQCFRTEDCFTFINDQLMDNITDLWTDIKEFRCKNFTVSKNCLLRFIQARGHQIVALECDVADESAEPAGWENFATNLPIIQRFGVPLSDRLLLPIIEKPSLEELVLWGTPTALAQTIINRLKLKKLTLDALDNFEAKIAINNTTLKQLDIPWHVSYLSINCPKLETLYLESANNLSLNCPELQIVSLGSSVPSQVAQLLKCEKLRKVRLLGEGTSEESIKQNIELCNRLENYKLAHQAYPSRLAIDNNNLRKLKMRIINEDDAMIESISVTAANLYYLFIDGNNRVNSLNIITQNITTVVLDRIEGNLKGLEELPNLEMLKLSEMPHIRSLNIKSTKLRDLNVTRLKCLEDLQIASNRLQKVTMLYFPILTSTWMQELQKSSKYMHTLEIDLAHCDIRELTFPYLHHLEIYGCMKKFSFHLPSLCRLSVHDVGKRLDLSHFKLNLEVGVTQIYASGLTEEINLPSCHRATLVCAGLQKVTNTQEVQDLLEIKCQTPFTIYAKGDLDQSNCRWLINSKIMRPSDALQKMGNNRQTAFIHTSAVFPATST